MKKFLLLLALPLAAFAGELPPSSATVSRPPDKEKLKAELARMEDAFCAMTKEKGILAAFEHFAAPNATFIDTDPTRYQGLEAVRKRIGPDQPGVTVTWSAAYTDVSDDGTMGYNYGRYEWRLPTPDGKEKLSTGYFLTIWKRQPDGTWRYVMDTGVADKPAPKPAEKAEPEKKS